MPVTTYSTQSNNAPVDAYSSDEAPALPNGLDLHHLVRFLKRWAKIIAFTSVLCALLALVFAFTLKPVYQSEALVMKDQQKTDMANVGQVMEALGTDYNATLRSQIDIITSRSVLDRVITKLDLLNDPEFATPPSISERLGVAKWFYKSDHPELSAIQKQTALANTLRDKLKVSNDGRSMSIHIAFESHDPSKAALIANKVADEYLVDQLESKYEATARVNQWLEDRLGTLKQKLEASEKAVGDFREKNKLIQVSGGTTIAARQMEEVNNQLTEARAQTSQAEARLQSIEKMVHSSSGSAGAADVMASPIIQNLRAQEAELRGTQAELASKYGELHPKMIKARAEYADLEKKISEEVTHVIQSMRNEANIARAKQSQLQSQLQKLERQAGVEMKDDVVLNQLQREADANRTLYESFLNRFKQTGEQEELNISDSRIIERAEPSLTPIFPKKTIFLIIGLFLGSILGICIGYLTEYFEPGFKTAAQLENETGIPVIGLLPIPATIKRQTVQDYVLDKPFSSYSEVLRSVRTAIHFSNVDDPPKILMVTSSLPAEGKTTLCLALARILAKSGNHILLIDADMRRPNIANAVGLKNVQNSLAELLMGNKKFAEVIYNDPLMPALDILPTQHAPNPQDLLGSARMREILAEARMNYDLVIVDTPPLLAVSDAAILSKSVDTAILLVRWATTPRESVARTVKMLKNFGSKFTGAVMSQVNLQEHAKYGESHFQHKYDEYYTN